MENKVENEMDTGITFHGAIKCGHAVPIQSLV